MKLFEVLPEKIFQLFIGKNRQVYAEALLLLYEQYQINRFGIEYELMRDLLQELIETQESLGYTFAADEDGEVIASSATMYSVDSSEGDLFRFKANHILRRFKALGWLDVEVRDNFQQYILLPHYSSRILQVLKELCEDRTVEFQRYAFVTYQLLISEESKRRPAFAIIEAEKTTEQFTSELTLLANNMKFHAEQVAAKTRIQDVLDHHFDEYKAKIIDKSYHRLKTSDHVSRYRHQILDRVRTYLMDQDLFQEAVEDGIRSDFYADRQEAEYKLRKALIFIEEVYRELDDVFNRIDLRHNQYLRASFDRARYLSQHSQGVDQKLAEILDWISVRVTLGHDAVTQAIGQEGLFFLTLSQLSEPSLFTPRKKRAPHQAEEMELIEIPDELKSQLKEKSLLKMRHSITREKVRDYVLRRLDQRETMNITELAPKNLEEFLYLTHVYLYGYDGEAGYILERENNRILEIGGYRFYDRTIRRLTNKKGGLNSVRTIK